MSKKRRTGIKITSVLAEELNNTKTKKKTCLSPRMAREKLANAVRRSNAAFKRMPKPEKRVQIAKDVIAALKARVIRADAGTYFSSSTPPPKDPRGVELKTQLDKMPTCNVCALGAAFVCAVKRVDALKMDRLDNEGVRRDWDDNKVVAWSISQPDMHRYLKKFFDVEQLEMIENAFERGTVNRIPNRPSDGSNFMPDVFDGRKRMIAIMENIIRNGGVFVPAEPRAQEPVI